VREFVVAFALLRLGVCVWVMCGGGANSSCSLAPVKRILCPAIVLASLQVVRVVWERADCLVRVLRSCECV